MYFKEFAALFQKNNFSERLFYQDTISVEHVLVTVSVFCVSCELKNSKSSSFFR